MKSSVFIILLFLALLAAFTTLISDGSYSRMRNLEQSVASQREKNQELKEQVGALRQEVQGLQHDDRVLEKAARNELGLARPGENLVIFDKGASRGQ
ncbi:MAG: septum formation initiator family protein [Oligoflexia bacterium]|nr:septum formation initiator family protein [Oligoflexia bacterium]